MIRVEPQPEPEEFDERVRQPGKRALDEGRDDLPSYWRRCTDQLYDAYGGICAYLSVWISRDTEGRSVEHFAPKSKYRDLTYEWSNYRLVSTLMNSRKRDFEDVLDPFEIQNGWFELEFMVLQVRPSGAADAAIRARVQETIDRLKLNDRESRRAREEYYDEFLGGNISLDFLRRRCPFVAYEMERQGQTQ